MIGTDSPEFVWCTFLIPVIPQILFFTISYVPLWLIEKYKNIPSRSLQKLFLGLTALYFGGTFSSVLAIGMWSYFFNIHIWLDRHTSFSFGNSSSIQISNNWKIVKEMKVLVDHYFVLIALGEVNEN